MNAASCSNGFSSEPAGVSTSTMPLPELLPATAVPVTRPKSLAALNPAAPRPRTGWRCVDPLLHRGLAGSLGGGEGQVRPDPEDVDVVEERGGGGEACRVEELEVVEADEAQAEPVLVDRGVADVADREVLQAAGAGVSEGGDLRRRGRAERDVELLGGGARRCETVGTDDRRAGGEHRDGGAALEEGVERPDVVDAGDLEGGVARRGGHAAIEHGCGDRGGRTELRVGGQADLVDRRAPEVGHAPGGDVVHRRHLGGDVGTQVEQGVRQATHGLVHVDDVGAGRIGLGADRRGGVEGADLDPVREEPVDQGVQVTGRALSGADGQDVGAREHDRVLVVDDVPEGLPLRRSRDCRDVGGGEGGLRLTGHAAPEHLDLVGEHRVAVLRDVVDDALDGLRGDVLVDLRVRGQHHPGALAVLGELDGAGHRAEVGGVLGAEDRREVVPAVRGVAVGDLDVRGIGAGVGGDRGTGGDVVVGVAGDVRGDHVVLDAAGDRVAVGDEEVDTRSSHRAAGRRARPGGRRCSRGGRPCRGPGSPGRPG